MRSDDCLKITTRVFKTAFLQEYEDCLKLTTRVLGLPSYKSMKVFIRG